MKSVLVILPALLAALSLAACQGAPQASAPVAAEGPERELIQQSVQGYYLALQQPSRDEVRKFVMMSVGDPDVDRVQKAAQERGYQLVEVLGVEQQGNAATASVRLKDATGATAERKIGLEKDGERWKINKLATDEGGGGSCT